MSTAQSTISVPARTPTLVIAPKIFPYEEDVRFQVLEGSNKLLFIDWECASNRLNLNKAENKNMLMINLLPHLVPSDHRHMLYSRTHGPHRD